MNKVHRLLVLGVLIFVFASLAHAVGFTVEVIAIKDKIDVDDVAEFNIAITNNMDTQEEFTINKAGYPFWDMYTKPLQNPITLKVPAKNTASIRLYVDPLYITSVDTYTLDASVTNERTGEEQKIPITIGIRSTAPLIGGYIPTVITSVSISPGIIDPRQEAKIKIVINNQNVIDYPNLTIKIDSSHFKDEIYIPLGPKEEKTIELAKKLDDMTLPDKDRLVVSIFSGERTIVNPIVKEFEIKEYSVQEGLPKEQSFLKIRKGFRVFSNNPDYKGMIKTETTPLKNLFLGTSPKAESLQENDKDYLMWNIQLDSNREMVVYTNENYRPLVVILIVLAGAVIVYFLFRSPIVVSKSIASVGTSEGGVSEAKVVVRVKNRSSGQIANIEVLDYLTHIAHVEKELSIGSMQPHAVMQHPKKGMIIKWNIETLEAGDERVLSYKMKSRLAILGEFNLPSATARCKIGDKVIISNSNRVSIGS